MKRIESFEELKAMQVAERAKMTVRDGLAPTEANLAKHQVLICAGTGCTSNKSAEVKAALEAKLAAEGMDKEIQVVQTGCFGFCSLGPIMVVYPEGTFYNKVEAKDIDEIVEKHLKTANWLRDCSTLSPARKSMLRICSIFLSSRNKNVSLCVTAVPSIRKKSKKLSLITLTKA